MTFDQLAQQFAASSKTNNKVFDLYTRLAGQDYEHLKGVVMKLHTERGQKFGRALADALIG